MGTGHLRRCLALAEMLKKCVGRIVFICRDLPGNVSHLVTQANFELILIDANENDCRNLLGMSLHKQWLGVSLEQEIADMQRILPQYVPVDLFIIDHYALDDVYERALRPHAKKIMVIDDLADRVHDCDILLDQNYYLNKDERYQGLVPENSELLLGPQYALLREEFALHRPKSPKLLTKVKKVLVNFGGGDIKECCARLLWLIQLHKEAFSGYQFLFIAGDVHANVIQESLKRLPNCDAIALTESMATLMADYDVFIGASGSTTWERGMMAIPSLAVSIAANQDQILHDGEGVFHYKFDLFSDDAAQWLLEKLQDIEALNRQASVAWRLMASWRVFDFGYLI